MSDKREWFYPGADGAESVGPLTTEQVAEKLRSGELKVDDYVWGSHFEDQDWRRIFELEELRPHLPVKQAPKPRMAPPIRVKNPDDDDDRTIVDNPVQREKDHPNIAGESTSPGFVKALIESPEPEKAKAPEPEPVIVRNLPRAIEAPTDDFASAEIERTNPSMRFTRPPDFEQQPAPSGIREMTLDSFIAQTETPKKAPEAPAAPPPAPPVAVAPPPMAPPPIVQAPPPHVPPPIPALPALDGDTATALRSSSENTVLTQRPPELAPVEQTMLTQSTAPTRTLPDLPALDHTKLTQPTQPMPEPTASLPDDKTIPSVESLLGHVRAEEPPPPEPASLPPVTTVTPEPVSVIGFTPILEEPVTESKPAQELRTNTQTKTPSGGSHIGGRRVSGTGSHMSTRTGNTNFGGGQKTFTPKQEAFHAPATDDFKATHDEPGEYGTENAYRRYPRVPFNTEVIMRDDREYHRFRSIDISEKGVRIKVEDISLFTKGEEITITVRSAPGIGTFSCKGVVMRILRADEGPGYGIFFMQLNPNIRRRITQFVLDQMSAKLNRSATRGGPAAA